MKTVGFALLLGLAACGGSNAATKSMTTAKAEPPPPAPPVLYDPSVDTGTTYQSAKPGIFDAPGSSGDIEGMPAPGY